MPYDTITGGLEQASRLGHSEAAVRTLAERASFYVPAEHLRDLAWLRPKIRPKAGLPRPEDADRLTGVIGVDGSMMPVRVRDGLPSVHYGYAQAAAVWLDIEAMESQRARTVRGSRCPAQRGHLGACLARPSPVRGVPARGHIHPGLMARARRLALPDQEGRGEPAQPEPAAAAAAGSRPARQARHDGARQLPGPPVRPAPGSGRRRRDELSRLRGAPVPGRHAPHLRGGDGGRVQPGRPGQADAGDRAAGAGRPNDLALGAVPARRAPVDSVHHGRAARDVRAAGQAARPRRHLLPADDRDHARRRSLPVRRRENRDGRRLRVRAGPARRAPSR